MTVPKPKRMNENLYCLLKHLHFVVGLFFQDNCFIQFSKHFLMYEYEYGWNFLNDGIL